MATSAQMMRRRSSSRCSRNDILPCARTPARIRPSRDRGRPAAGVCALFGNGTRAIVMIYAGVPVLVRLTVGSSELRRRRSRQASVLCGGDRRRLLGLHLRPLLLLLLDPDLLLERERSSLEAFLNSPMLLPSERPSSGSFRGPKMISAITRMMTSSGMPMEPNIGIAPAGVHRHYVVGYGGGGRCAAPT